MSDAKVHPVDKGLPVSPDAERFVLGSILLDDKFYIQVAAGLPVEAFSTERNRQIYKRMGDLSEKGRTIDRVTVANELAKNAEMGGDGLSYLISLDDGLPKVSNIDEYVRILREKYTLRQIIFTSQHMMNRAMAGVEDSDAILAGARETLLTMGGDDDSGPQTPAEIIQSMPGGISQFLGPPKQGLLTGFHKFDEMTGGLHSGEFTIIAARPGVGKSALALNIAQHAALDLGKTVMFFSLEMSKEQLMNRLVCGVARVDMQRKRLGYLNSDERRRLAIALNRVTESNLYIDDKSAASPSDLHSRIRRRMSRGPVHLVIGDYLQLMSTGKKFENRNQEVSYISRGMKLLTAEIKAPVVMLSQLSRAPETRKGSNRPQLSDLRESGSLEQDADNVHFIFREEMYSKDREDLRGVAELIIGKQRSGPTGTVNLVFLHAQTKFENRAEDSQPMLENQTDAPNDRFTDN